MARKKFRFANGYGTIYKLSGNRRRPWIARKTTGWEYDEKGERVKQLWLTIGYYETENKAISALEEYNNNGFSPNADKYTFDDLYKIWSERKYEKIAPSNSKGYKSAYKRFDTLATMKMRDIRAKHLQDIIDNNNWNYPMKQRAKSIMMGVYALAMENDITQKDYSKYVDVGSKKDDKKKKLENGEVLEDKRAIPFTDEEIKLLWSNIDIPYLDTILMMIYTGFRCSELLGLLNSNIDLENRFIVGGMKTEAGENRTVPIHKDVLPLFEKYYGDGKNKYLIPNKRDNQMHYESYTTYKWNPIMKQLKLKHHTHDCRKTFATKADAQGMDRLCLKLILGHAIPDVTEKVYIIKTKEDLRDALDAIKLC